MSNKNTTYAMKKEINIVVAIGKNRVIGKNNQLIWKISDDLKRFKAITSGYPIIMGRKTFESIGKPLPNRTNIVVTRNTEYAIDGITVVNSLDGAIKKGFELGEQIFIIGGQEIYKQAIEKANRIYLTLVEDTAEGDAFFPDYSMFKKIISKEDFETKDGLGYSFIVLER